MLSKIFVSLLILSALTSEGAINLTEYLFSPYLYADEGLSSVLEKSDTCVEEKNHRNQKKIVKDDYDLLFTVSFSSSYVINIKDNLNKLFIDFNPVKHQDVGLCSHSKVCFQPLFLQKEKKMVLNSSDLSPPII
ncbi:hypothetical protein RBH29_13250 [Herbivorax sp. ANBcel31]|uniref:hypothetical protein n=1 Tax=Herbivorax sp. ANBcel31 TaxID=3069754 RepID=UPI0027B1410D|nr:hypothetical protein [Herbivorax sp. ANBcel31]MDQ2087392.1 hypothetical protein [Herbivorax sp. ANBcel31]